MHRIDADGAVAGLFTEGDPGQAIPATVVSDDWLNDVQENLAQFIEAAGLTLAKGTYTQLTAAVAAYIATHNAVTNPHSAASAATASRLMLRDAAGRSKVADPSASDDIATKGYVDVIWAAHVAASGAGFFTVRRGFPSPCTAGHTGGTGVYTVTKAGAFSTTTVIVASVLDGSDTRIKISNTADVITFTTSDGAEHPFSALVMP